jgi:hypothetical protein
MDTESSEVLDLDSPRLSMARINGEEINANVGTATWWHLHREAFGNEQSSD